MTNILPDSFQMDDRERNQANTHHHHHGHHGHAHSNNAPIKTRRSFLNMLNLDKRISANSTTSSVVSNSSVSSLDYLTSPEVSDDSKFQNGMSNRSSDKQYNVDSVNIITDSNNANFIITSSISPTWGSRRASHSMANLKKFFRSPISKKKKQINMHGSPTTTTSSDYAMNSNHSSYSHINANHHRQPHHSQRTGSEQFEHSSIINSISPNNQRNVEHKQHTQSAIPPTIESSLSLSNKVDIFHDDSILVQKYGKLGKLLGSGAGGSVKIINRSSDGATFAVKEFRPQKPRESDREYHKKCTAEFLIGSVLHHPNIIETLDIFIDYRHHKYFEVMEYCPVDFFAVVMSNKMSRNEINCCIKQLTEGVKYLHDKGMAHRDLKLDNCVMNKDGILKIIDFGSSVVFKYPFEKDTVMAHGIVGSDPYLAPEVLTSSNSYDPQMVDVWSIAIIYCCLMLKRFPWKIPHPETDENFRLFCLPDEVEHDYVESARTHELLIKEKMMSKKLQQQGYIPEQQEYVSTKQQSQQVNNISSIPSQLPPTNTETEQVNSSSTNHRDNGNTHRRVEGPYRLFKLLPHASRPILSRMLELDPKKRATLEDVYNDEWFSSQAFCTQNKNKEVMRAPGHHHTIVTEQDGVVNEYRI
ncbi:hypothetical protein TPHA_0G00730 [Tetrapisispora phaffii CBS 4417]|uniref:non-specific serine/threonine protein kinase n=1 Tax=Tetrapisispora phaffii (strain ATCC 24235 / CBS 4417 / NBRC 1672 / NRRL Y-8282 / UCD 70-5) TaxID=1071381 RepID=G8BVI1_TETPH|nr:hypothetical protein TPHA_0G00730 [Tetrapisispora phaffii CBS 4417]CCE63909.1 hypothetical protein TPHA_0G00730 [Tetrapisispora phaffii CBS 4417]